LSFYYFTIEVGQHFNIVWHFSCVVIKSVLPPNMWQ